MKRESDSYLKTIEEQNDTIARIIKEFENSQELNNEIIDETGKMLDKLENDKLKSRGDYLARSNDLYNQLGRTRLDFNEEINRYKEKKIIDNNSIEILSQNVGESEQLMNNYKHLIEQLGSSLDDKDKNIEELKKD